VTAEIVETIQDKRSKIGLESANVRDSLRESFRRLPTLIQANKKDLAADLCRDPEMPPEQRLNRWER
jgi:hypothetical protein